MAEQNNNNQNENNQNNQNQNNQNNNQSQNNVNIETEKQNAVSEYIKSLGYEDADSLKAVIDKAKEAEKNNMTEIQRKDSDLKETTKTLVAEREARMIAEAKLTALTLGANPDLVEDLVVVAKSKATKEKDINAVIAEIKDGSTGKIYFSEKQTEQNPTRQNVGFGNRNNQNNNNNEDNNKGTIAERIFSRKQKQGKSHYFAK